MIVTSRYQHLITEILEEKKKKKSQRAALEDLSWLVLPKARSLSGRRDEETSIQSVDLTQHRNLSEGPSFLSQDRQRVEITQQHFQ